MSIAASQSLTFTLGESGTIYAFGYCSYYRCGAQFDGQMLFEPTKLDLGIKVSAAFLTVHGSYFRADNGTSFVMGYNYFAEMCTEE